MTRSEKSPDTSRPDMDEAAYEGQLAEHTIGPLQPLAAPIEIRDYDPLWPRLFEREAARIGSVLGERIVRIEHVGSTSVAGLPAKPIIDIALEVPDSGEEPAYIPDLEGAGYVLRAREPAWFQHRFFRRADADVHLHTFSAGCTEVDRKLLFRDWLGPTPRTASSMCAPSVSWRLGRGSICSSTRMPRPRWCERFCRARRLPEAPGPILDLLAIL